MAIDHLLPIIFQTSPSTPPSTHASPVTCEIRMELDQWGICGGNRAFTAAWLCPDEFRRVTAFLSGFTQMPGGNPYPELIPRIPSKPPRVFLQAGHRDLRWNVPEGN
ncbi:hypothetical protein ACIP4W_39470 [Streptomyces sp. NPDC088846]|uniref:hypothetical protein n=1 Tax=unclassified Streptomyces TaxID=2593676 RepID=UPI0038243671